MGDGGELHSYFPRAITVPRTLVQAAGKVPAAAMGTFASGKTDDRVDWGKPPGHRRPSGVMECLQEWQRGASHDCIGRMMPSVLGKSWETLETVDTGAGPSPFFLNARELMTQSRVWARPCAHRVNRRHWISSG